MERHYRKSIIIYSNSNKVLKLKLLVPILNIIIYFQISSPLCKNGLVESSSTITSPNYPAPYPKSSDCKRVITSAPGTKIQLVFAFFQTQLDGDFVYVTPHLLS